MHLLPFPLRAPAVLRRHTYWFLAGKSQSHVAAHQICWVPNFRHFVTTPPPTHPSTLICHYLLLFATIRHCSPLFATIRTISFIRYSRLFAVCCSLFATIRYSLFGFSRHPTKLTVRLHLQICINAPIAENTVHSEGILKWLIFAAYTETRRLN